MSVFYLLLIYIYLFHSIITKPVFIYSFIYTLIFIYVFIFNQVVKYWPEKGKSGFLVWRYLLKRNDDEPAPWTRDGKERVKKLGLTMQVTSPFKSTSLFVFPLCFSNPGSLVLQYPEGYLEAVAAKEKEKENKNEEDVEETPTKGKRKRKSQTGRCKNIPV